LPDVSLGSMPSRPFGELNNPVQGPLTQYGVSDLFSLDGSERARRSRLAPTGYVEAYV